MTPLVSYNTQTIERRDRSNYHRNSEDDDTSYGKRRRSNSPRIDDGGNLLLLRRDKTHTDGSTGTQPLRQNY